MKTTIEVNQYVRQFLEIATGLEVRYSYPKIVALPDDSVLITYQAQGAQNLSVAVNNQLLSERKMFVVTVQAQKAILTQFYVDMIKQATNEFPILYISENIVQYPNKVKSHVGTIILSYYNGFDNMVKRLMNEEEARSLVQAFADRLIFNTNIYRDILGNAHLDRYIVPELTYDYLEEILPGVFKKDQIIFGEAQIRQLLQIFADKLIFNTSVYRTIIGDATIDRYIVPELTDQVKEEIKGAS